MKITRGFTVVEILAAMAVLVILTALSYTALIGSNQNQALENEAQKIATLLDRARVETLNSKQATRYGVHFATDKAILFSGDTYIPSSTNVEQPVDGRLSITLVSLAGGGNDVIFKRLTGETEQFGTVQISLNSDPTKTKTVKIYSTGLIEREL